MWKKFFLHLIFYHVFFFFFIHFFLKNLNKFVLNVKLGKQLQIR